MKVFSTLNRIWGAPVVPFYICRGKVFRGGEMKDFFKLKPKMCSESVPKESVGDKFGFPHLLPPVDLRGKRTRKTLS